MAEEATYSVDPEEADEQSDGINRVYGRLEHRKVDERARMGLGRKSPRDCLPRSEHRRALVGEEVDVQG